MVLADGDFDDNLRAVVRVLMKWRGISHERLAASLGISRATVFNRFRVASTTPPTQFVAAEVATMAELFRVPIEVLFQPVEDLIPSELCRSSGKPRWSHCSASSRARKMRTA